jgi:hypothetical protein
MAAMGSESQTRGRRNATRSKRGAAIAPAGPVARVTNAVRLSDRPRRLLPAWPRVARALVAWTSALYALTAALTALAFVGLCIWAGRIHHDISPQLAAKLPLLELHPKIIFAGDSRTAQQVDPAVAANILGKPPGYAVNMGAVGADPLAYLAAARERPAAFRDADLVLGLSPYHLNDGNRKEFFFSTGAIARLGLGQKLLTFVPAEIETLMWFIRDAFQAQADRRRNPGLVGPLPAHLGQEPLTGHIATDEKAATTRYYDWLHSEITAYEGHTYYRDWQSNGYKAHLVEDALCALRPRVHRLVIVSPPWAPIAQFTGRPAWRGLEAQFRAELSAIARACGSEFVPVEPVEGLTLEHFADETHVNDIGAPLYTAYLLRQLGYQPDDRAPALNQLPRSSLQNAP